MTAVVSPREWVRAWRPSVPGISEVFHARFVDHRYPLHAHDDWTVFTVDDGAIRYGLDSHDRGVGSAVVTLLPPNVVHDGRAASEAGFRKRVLYVGTELLPETLAGRAVDDPDVRDQGVLTMTRRLHTLLEHPDDALAAEEAVVGLAAAIRAHLGGRSTTRATTTSPDRLAEGLRDLLDARRSDRITLAAAGRVLEADTSTLLRAFRRAFGITPHRYVVARRIELARKRLLAGEAIADVAAAVGFYDQAHFTRHFTQHVGTTPGRFAAP